MIFTLPVNGPVMQDSGGPLILALRDSRIALGRGMAEKLTVTIIEEPTA